MVLFWYAGITCCSVFLLMFSQSAALAMQEKERVASEEAEKRLKAALTAKREPNVTTSRVASPSTRESSAAIDTADAKNTDAQIADVSVDSPDAPSTNATIPEVGQVVLKLLMHPELSFRALGSLNCSHCSKM